MNNQQENEIDSAQTRFEKMYITSAEIILKLGVSRSAILYARRTGKLPDAIEVLAGNLYVWEREPIEPYLNAWKMVLDARRGD